MSENILRSWIDLVSKSFLAEALEDIADVLQSYKDDPMVFVSFSSLPKLGINPRTDYNTPAGIYTYPIKDIWHQIEDDTIPYASERPYAVVVRPRTAQGILDVDSYTEAEYQQHLFRLKTQILPYWLHPTQTTQPVDIDDLIQSAEQTTRLNTPAGRLWNVTRLAATEITKSYKRSVRATVAWNMLLRELGITGVVDRGKGLIHPNEPTQAMWTSAGSLETLAIVRNVRKKKRLSPQEIMRWVEYDGTRIFGLHHKSMALWIAALSQPVPVIMAALEDNIKIPENALVLAAKQYGKNWSEFVIYDMLETKYPFSKKFLASLAEHCRAAFIPLVEKRMLTYELAILAVKQWPGRLALLKNHGRDIPTELVDLATQEHGEDAFWAAMNLRFITSQTEANCRERLGDEYFEELRKKFDKKPA